jgi:hypothetical protein
MQVKTRIIVGAVVLTVATVVAFILLLIEALESSGGAVKWTRLLLPIAIGAGMASSALKARRRGDQESTLAMLGWGALANAAIASLVP